MNRPIVRFATASATALVLSGCASIDPVGSASNALSPKDPGPSEINWPPQYEPDRATFFVHNEIEIDAPPELVWGVLIDAGAWADWYAGASNVRLPDDAGGRLAANTSFHWRTMGYDFTSVVHEFTPPYRLAWESRRRDIRGYHAWLIIPTERGCRVVTDESQFGFLANMQKLFVPNKLRRLHDDWLAGLRARAEARATRATATREGA